MKSNLFNFNRIGRVRFLAYTNVALFLSVFLLWYLFPIIAYDLLDLMLYSKVIGISSMYFMYAFLLLIPIKFLAQRYRDSGVSGWLALVGCTPISFGAMYLMMALFPGESSINKYGDSPEPASKVELFIAIFSGVAIVPLFIGVYL